MTSTFPQVVRLAVALSLAAWVSSVSAQPAISFEPESIQISGLTPGGDSVYLAAARIAHGYSRDMATETGKLSDSDGDGVTSIPLHRRLPLHSLWIAIDLSTGRSVIAFPDGSGGGGLHRPEKLKLSDLRELARESPYVMFLLVRPGVGAWTLTIEDSDRHDADRRPDSKVKLRIGDMQPIGSSPAVPQHLAKNDVVFVVDPINLRAVELRDEVGN